MYFDTAYIVKLYLPEIGSDVISELFTENKIIISSEIAIAEFASVLLRKRREGVLNKRQHSSIQAQFNADQKSGALRLLPVSRNILSTVQITLENAPNELTIRSLDAIHLCSCKIHGFTTIYSSDNHVIRAAPTFGLKAKNILALPI